MTLEGMLSGGSISASGMYAERLRMDIVANNLANANTTRTADGGPYQRRQAVFRSVLRDAGHPYGLGGVEVTGVVTDKTASPARHMPGHPDADANGMVQMSNVKPAFEMVDMISATRSYEANLRAMKTFREMAEQGAGLAAR